MNKLIIVFLSIVISSCGVLRAPEYSNLIENILFGADDIIVDDQFYNDQEFSFAKVQIGKNNTAIVTLGFVVGETLQWFSSSQSGIYTQNGKIVSLVDFSNDMRLSASKTIDFSIKSTQRNFMSITLKDPDGFFTQESSLYLAGSEEISYLQKPMSANLYIEKVSTNGLYWNFENKYWVDPTSGSVIISEQIVHPRLPKIRITFYYKYLD